MNNNLNRYDGIIDSHVHPIKSLATGKSIINEMDVAGVNKAVILALDLDKYILDNNPNLKEQIIEDLYAYSLFIDPYRILRVMKQIIDVGSTPNTLIANLVSEFPQRFIGFGSVSPRKETTSVKEKLKEINKLNLKGIKLLPTLQFFKPIRKTETIFNSNNRLIYKNINIIFNFARKQDIPILIHSGKDPGPWEIHTLRCVQNTHPKYWRQIIKKYKNNKIIFAHLGCYGYDSYYNSWLEEVLFLAEKYSNIYLDTSAVTFHLENNHTVTRIRETCGFKRILFGTDTPIVRGTNMSHSIRIIDNSPVLTQEEKVLILSKNAKNLFNIK